MTTGCRKSPKVTKGFKTLANELERTGAWRLSLAVRRGVDARDDKRRSLSDLRRSAPSSRMPSVVMLRLSREYYRQVRAEPEARATEHSGWKAGARHQPRRSALVEKSTAMAPPAPWVWCSGGMYTRFGNNALLERAPRAGIRPRFFITPRISHRAGTMNWNGGVLRS